MDLTFFFAVFVILGILFVLGLLTLVAYRRAWRIPQPNEAFIIVGKSRGGDQSAVVQERIEGSTEAVTEAIDADRLEGLDYRIATAAVWVNPLTMRTFSLSLKSRSTPFVAEGHDMDKIQVTVQGQLMFKVGDNLEAMARAARRFLEMGDEEINAVIENLVTGQVRALIGTMTIEQLITDRATLMDRVQEATKTDMAKIGLQIDSLNIQQITDNQGYIENLGRPQAEATARSASIAADQARREKEEAKQAADIEIARVRRDTEVKAAEYKAEQDKALETAAQAGPRARAEAEAAVVEQETRVAEMRVAMAAQTYEAEVGERAKADAFRVRQEADAEKHAELARIEAEAAREKQIGEARAAAVQAAGEAEARAVEARGLAEARAIEEKAKALAENGDAVIEQRISEIMPEIAAAVAGPLGSIDNLVVLDGPEGLTKAVTGGIAATGQTAFAIRDLVHVMRGSEPSVGNGDGDRPETPSGRPAGSEAQPTRRRASEGRSAPPLGDILPRDDVAAAVSTTGDLSEGREQITVVEARRGLGALRDTMGGDLSALDAEGVKDLGETIRSDPEARAAFQAIAEDDATFEEMMDELPLRGAGGRLFEKFARELREQSVADRDSPER